MMTAGRLGIPIAAPGAIPEAASAAELLSGARDRQQLKAAEALSGSSLERALINGEPHVIKHLTVDHDWIMRATGDLGSRQLLFWRSAAPGQLPGEIDHAMAGMAEEVSPSGRVTATLLLRDVSEHLVPDGDTPIPLEQERRFLDHMAALHAAFWGWRDELGLIPLSHHYVLLSPVMASLEADRGTSHAVPPLVARGWRRLPEAAPRTHRLLESLVRDPWPLVAALQRTPSTLIHADWKLGNLGSHPDGRTIVIDWDRCGQGAGCMDLAWYLAVNCDRMPHTKEAAIDRYRSGLERRGIDTAGWFELQLGLALIGALLQLGWAKAGGDRTELSWWEDRALEAAHLL